MKENPYVMIAAYRIRPEEREKGSRWAMEVYIPEMMKTQTMKGVDRYQIAVENPDYPRTFTLLHFDRYGAWNDFFRSPFGIAFGKNLMTRVADGILVPTWNVVYQLVKGFRNDGEPLWASADRGAENSPVMQLEGYSLAPEVERKYTNWLTDDGYRVFIPLLLKLPGLKECGCYRIVDERAPPEVPQPEDFSVHPRWLSILHFENVKAFEDYENSLELAAMRAALKAPFPGGLEYKWYVQYRVLVSSRK